MGRTGKAALSEPRAYSQLWEALTSGDFSVKYWFGFRLEMEPKAGGKIRIVPPRGSEHTGDQAGKVLVYEPPRKLAYEFVIKCGPEVAAKRREPSRASFELTPQGSLVKLRLIHENLLPEDVEKNPQKFEAINNGWPAVLSSLKSLLETGKEIVY